MRFASQTLLARSRCYFVLAHYRTRRRQVGVLLLGMLIFGTFACRPVCADEPVPEGVSTREARAEAIRGVPFHRLNNNVASQIRDVVEKPSYFRRMPTQQIECDPKLFTFLVRRPEVMVNIWDMMGITKVSTRRVSPLTFLADDGVGTTCKCDLVYGDNNVHIYFGDGIYDGTMTPRKVSGRCVCILNSSTGFDASGNAVVNGTMDVFLRFDNFGADMLTRTIGPFVGKTADSNFVETAKFISQISLVCEHSPSAALGLAMKLDKVDASVRREFMDIAAAISKTLANQMQLETKPTTAPLSSYDSMATETRQSTPPLIRRSMPNPWIEAPAEALRLSDSSGVSPMNGQVDQPAASPRIDSTASSRNSGPANSAFQHPVVPRKPNVFMRR